MNIDVLSEIEMHYTEFSKTNKKIADFIRKNTDKVAFLTINEIANFADVSKASVSRFAKDIGFDGYIKFQKALAAIVIKNVTPMKEIKKSIAEGHTDTILQRIITDNTIALQNLYTNDLQQEFRKTIEQFRKRKGNIYITASRSSLSVAYYLYFMLSGFDNHIRLLIDNGGNLSQQLSGVRKEECLIAISYAKYTKITYEIVGYCADKGCNITAITDSYTSPIAVKANQVLLAKNAGISYSFVGAMAVANAIVSAVGKLKEKSNLDLMHEQDIVAKHLGVYL